MNYMKQNYQNFDTGNNPNSRRSRGNRKNKFIYCLSKLTDDGIKDEQIYISTPRLDEKLSKFYAKKEMEELKNSQ